MRGLYLVTDRQLIGDLNLQDIVLEAVKNGVSMVQLREKTVSTRDYIELAKSIKKVLTPYDVPLVINDRVDVALAAGIQGVHLGQSDMPVVYARQLLGEKAIIGLSVETLEQVEVAQNMAIDYIGVSGIFPTPTKTDLDRFWGLEGLAEVRRNTHLPLVAIGGIHRTNLCDVVAAGADMVAVVSAICGAANPGEATRQLMSCLKSVQ